MAASRYMCVEAFTVDRRGVRINVERGDLVAASDPVRVGNPDRFVEADESHAVLAERLAEHPPKRTRRSTRADRAAGDGGESEERTEGTTQP